MSAHSRLDSRTLALLNRLADTTANGQRRPLSASAGGYRAASSSAAAGSTVTAAASVAMHLQPAHRTPPTGGAGRPAPSAGASSGLGAAARTGSTATPLQRAPPQAAASSHVTGDARGVGASVPASSQPSAGHHDASGDTADGSACGTGSLAPSSSQSGQPVVSRSPAERLASPERLNLDRRGLTMCPLLQGEERLRLLNYQNNAIAEITNLHTLPFLIFLDLYNNQIKRISGLEQVASLRVLMLGKNQISTIDGMSALGKLDVLDLHCNEIKAIEGLSTLAELRVLNLAGNQIGRIDAAGLEGLTSLAELNLRRNAISAIAGVEALPSLQRLFLSYNSIGSVAGVSCLSAISGLLELALDGNPLSTDPSYRTAILEISRSIRHLDLRRVSEDERRAAQAHARRESERAAERARKERAEEERVATIRAIEHAWEGRTTASANSTGDHDAQTADEPAGSADDDSSAATSASQARADVSSLTRARARSAASNGRSADQAAQGGSSQRTEADRGHIELTEVAAGGVWLHAYGEAADTIDKASRVADAVGISISFFPFERIASNALPKLRGLRRLRELHLEHTELHSLHQLHSLSCVSGLTALRISTDGNPVVHHPQFRSLVTCLLPMLRSLNGAEVSPELRERAEREWRRLKRLYTLASNTLHARYAPMPFLHAMQFYDPAPTNTTKHAAAAASLAPAPAAPPIIASAAPPLPLETAYVNRIIEHAMGVDEKITQLNASWPRIVATYQARVREEVSDRSLFLRRYEAAARGEAGTLAMLDPGL